MSDHIPTTEEVREAFASRFWDDFSVYQPTEADLDEERADFDRWFAEVKADAWTEGAIHGPDCPIGSDFDCNPYRQGETE